MKLPVYGLTVVMIMFLTTSTRATDTVDCVLQAFGTGLEGKGIYVQVENPGFGCGSFATEPLKSSAKFLHGEAEVPLTLKANSFGICALAMKVWVTLPYKCDMLDRLITDIEWGHGFTQIGSCRVLQQKCGSVTSAAAIPYFDMWCRRPSRDGGRPEEMRLRWAFEEADDHC